MNAIEQLMEGQRILDDFHVDLPSARQAAISLHPQLAGNVSGQDMTLAVAAYTAHHAPKPLAKETMAEHIADESGAFPWAGPVGNGLSLDEYQERFREMAAEHLFLAQQMGFS